MRVADWPPALMTSRAMVPPSRSPHSSVDFIRQWIRDDQQRNAFDGRVVTRFPPEPNGFLHVGHAKSIFLNSEVAREFGGQFNLRFDDTNPLKETPEYVEAAQRDIRWLGVQWDGDAKFASDYFEQLYAWAQLLIRKGLAYVDDQSAAEIRATRGTLTTHGQNSPYRDRSVAENLDLFERMRAGEFGNGAKVLRARIDMASPNLNLRDPVLYRIAHATHHQTGNQWCIYPMYDWAHGQSDSLEGITHSLCTLEFADHNPLYQWFLENLEIYRPVQIEFARLELTHTMLHKRVLSRIMEQDMLDGWDDPRLGTLSGLRRRGVPPAAIRNLCQRVGVAKTNSMVEIELFEHCIRQELNAVSPRRMGVLDPVKLVLLNYPEDATEELEAINNPEDPAMGTRRVSFSRELYVERDDYRDNPPRRFHRLAIGREVRLRSAYLVTCVDVKRDAEGNVVEIHCTYDPETRGGSAPDGRRVRGTIHWVDRRTAVEVEVQLLEHLFLDPQVGHLDADSIIAHFNPDSRRRVRGVRVEPSAIEAARRETIQLERQGYFRLDCRAEERQPSLIRTIPLRDSWKKIEKKAA